MVALRNQTFVLQVHPVDRSWYNTKVYVTSPSKKKYHYLPKLHYIFTYRQVETLRKARDKAT